MTEHLNHLRRLAGVQEAAPVPFGGTVNAAAVKFVPGSDSASKMSIANRFPAEADINDPAQKKEVFLKALTSSPAALLAEINGRLDPKDENSLQAGERLSGIIADLEGGSNRVTDLDTEDRKFVIGIVAGAVKNMELSAGDTSAPEAEPEEEELKDSFNLDELRVLAGISQADESMSESEHDDDDDEPSTFKDEWGRDTQEQDQWKKNVTGKKNKNESSQSMTEGPDDTFDPGLAEILKQRGYTGPVKLTDLSPRWNKSLRKILLDDDMVMVQGDNPKYDRWVATWGSNKYYAYGAEMGYTKGNAKQVERHTRNQQGMTEGADSEVEQILAKCGSGDLDAYEIMSRPKTPAEQEAAKIIQDMFNSVTEDHPLHGDDDFEEILDIVCDRLSQDYGQGMSESQEDDDDESVGYDDEDDNDWESGIDWDEEEDADDEEDYVDEGMSESQEDDDDESVGYDDEDDNDWEAGIDWDEEEDADDEEDYVDERAKWRADPATRAAVRRQGITRSIHGIDDQLAWRERSALNKSHYLAHRDIMGQDKKMPDTGRMKNAEYEKDAIARNIVALNMTPNPRLPGATNQRPMNPAIPKTQRDYLDHAWSDANRDYMDTAKRWRPELRNRTGKKAGPVWKEAVEQIDEEKLPMVKLSDIMKDYGLTEASKPDFLDMDKDGDKKEPMKKAIKDADKKTHDKEDKTKESVEEHISDTTANAVQQALSELRKLAGL